MALPILPNMVIKGPFWTAEVAVIKLGGPQDHWAYRDLLVDISPRNALGDQSLLLPGTSLVLCFVQTVRITLNAAPKATYVWKRAAGAKPPDKPNLTTIGQGLASGQLALLLVQADPTAWPAQANGPAPEFTCINGEISLDPLKPQSNALDLLYRDLTLSKVVADDPLRIQDLGGAISVHSSGLSVFGQLQLPWWGKAPVAAPFQLAREIPDPAITPAAPGFRLTIETERLTASERLALVEAWAVFNSYVNPGSPLNETPDANRAPAWVTLEPANPLAVPRLHWRVRPWRENPGTLELHFERGELSLLFSDQPPYGAPTALARVTLDDVVITPDPSQADRLLISVVAGPATAETSSAAYSAAPLAGSDWQEAWSFADMQLAWSPLETPQFLRDAQNLALPEWVPSDKTPLAQPVLWGFMPLEDGWAQLPVPNLTEQIYIDAELVHEAASEPSKAPPFQGAAVFGNDRDVAGPGYAAEQPWSVTLLGAERIEGTWKLLLAGESASIADIGLSLIGPDVVANGLVWFGTARPTVEDALPTYDDWVAALKPVAARTVKPDDLFPAPITLALETLNLSRRPSSRAPDDEGNVPPVPPAQLGNWAFRYDAGAVIQQLVAKKVLPSNLFSRQLPLVWRRHPALPFVQALPLTQSKSPPNALSASRQLAPYELATNPSPSDDPEVIGLPEGWRFASSGAMAWPMLQSEAAPAREWAERFDLPMASLSLPGLALDPQAASIVHSLDGGPPAPVYRYDLPYTDEVNALAQLPKTPRDPDQPSPLPSETPPEPPRPLLREDLLDHWRRLAERGSLAAADAVNALEKQNGGHVMPYVVEPATWPVAAELKADLRYGQLEISNRAGGGTLPLAQEDALRGIYGRFAAEGTSSLRRLDEGQDSTGAFVVEAGSMAAFRQTNGMFRDQRGLARGPTQNGGTLLRTAVQLAGQPEYELISILQPLALDAAGTSWQCWFRDLPAKAQVFRRTGTLSDVAQDVNDPNATGREHNYLTGYEWRLGNGTDAAPLSLSKLLFYPLTLEVVTFAGDEVSQLEIVGRLQLPLAAETEQADLANAVRLTFTQQAGQLTLSKISHESPEVEWPLALSAGESGEAPRLRWSNISLAGDTLTIEGATLDFVLFDANWSIGLQPLVFPELAPMEIPFGLSAAPLAPRKLELALDLATPNHQHVVALTLGAQLTSPARQVTAGLQVLYVFEQDAENPALVRDVSGVGAPFDLTIADPAATSWSNGGLRVDQPTFISSAGPATKLIDGCKASNELTIEAWITPASLAQLGPARIVTVASGETVRNFSLGQGATGATSPTQYGMRVRTTTTSQSGNPPELLTPPNSVTQQQTHVVYTRSTNGATTLYINGAASASLTLPGDFSNWDSTFRLGLANEFGVARPWRGTYHQVALYSRALSPSEVTAHHAAGPNQTPPPERTSFNAEARIELIGPTTGAVTWMQGSLFDDLQLAPAPAEAPQPNVVLADNTLQFQWRSYSAREVDARLQLLPGVQLAAGSEAPGFAVFTFAVETNANIPVLQVKSAFTEALLACRWGEFLHDARGEATAAQAFGSSAGDLSLGYTAQLIGKVWDETLLLNGFLEVKNLISWPRALQFDAAQNRMTLPAARPATNPPGLSHLRHTVRVLFNQHAIPGDLLDVGRDELLFAFRPGQSWQFLAVVEHQLVETTPQADLSTMLGTDRRWATVQEVRLTSPAAFSQFLASRTGENRTTTPLDSLGKIADVNYGYLGAGLKTLLAGPGSAAVDKLPATTLLVEASAIHWIRQHHVEPPSATTLQFLPGGAQLGLLNGPEDYAPSTMRDPLWLLLSLPFVGRLQDELFDGLRDDSPAATSVLQTDPLVQIARARPAQAAPELALALAHWADKTPLQITVSPFDAAGGRTWARLDPISLEENWFRMQNPPRETMAKQIQSITAALPDTPARLSRSAALRRSFDALRRFYPPRLADDSGEAALPPEPISAAQLVWRQESMLVWQGISSLSRTNKPPYGWHLVGLQLVTSKLLADSPPADNPTTPLRYPAASVLPARLKLGDAANSTPLSFAVSPYLGLGFQPSGEQLLLRLMAAELLCVDRSTGQLRSVASDFFEWTPPAELPPTLDEQNAQAEQGLRQAAMAWAQASRARLCPDSSAAFLRLRELRDNVDADETGRAPLTTTYSYAIVPDDRPVAKLARRVFRIRAGLEDLRFREGQHGGALLPQPFAPFELAPPQVTGAQPIYLTERPPTSASGPDWPWGVSALRLSVEYTQNKAPAIGPLWNEDASEQLTLWWQAPQHTVQFRPTKDGGPPAAGLPGKWRAQAIKSLLPVVPQLPAPAIDMRAVVYSEAEVEANAGKKDADFVPIPAERLSRWQPVLPGALRFLLVGARSGVPFAIRTMLLRQSGLDPAALGVQRGTLGISGSVPVQHRAPRPVPLPPNKVGREDDGLQTWSSFFEPETLLAAEPYPLDEAFLGASASRAAQRLRLQASALHRATVGPTWNGEIRFDCTLGGTLPTEGGFRASTLGDWTLAAELTDGETTFRFLQKLEIIVEFDEEENTAPTALFSIDLNQSPPPSLVATSDGQADILKLLQQWIAGKTPGSPLTFNVYTGFVQPLDDKFRQTLSFLLRIADTVAPPLPLEPRFIHFEDPEYNRRLASRSFPATRIVKVPRAVDDKIVVDGHTVTIACDRREYNADSRVALRFDWDDNAADGIHGTAKLEIRRVSTAGVRSNPLLLASLNTNKIPLQARTLLQFSLLDLAESNGVGVVFVPGDMLELTLTVTPVSAITNAGETTQPAVPIVLAPRIVRESVIPVPQAAYALLRTQADDDVGVECVRFAWSPEPTRIELVNPDDLRSEVVRRRAVFHTNDAIRPTTLGGYAIQKITFTGSTHFPEIG